VLVNYIYKNNILTGGEFTIDMNSITCADVTDADGNAKLIGHLKGDDFFATNSYILLRLLK
jgi:hypothetical protein